MMNENDDQVRLTTEKKRVSVLTTKQLNESENNEEYLLYHSVIKGLELKVRREYLVDTVLNQQVVFYGEKFIVEDNDDSIWPRHAVLLDSKEMVDYVQQLLACPSKPAFRYQRTLKEKGLQIDDIIEFDNGVKGVIASAPEDGYGTNLRYVPLKGNGERSKHKPRTLYKNDKYTRIGKYGEPS